MRRLLAAISLIVFGPLCHAGPIDWWQGLDGHSKSLYSGGAMLAAIALYGSADLDYGDEHFHYADEDLFELRTDHGGVDKLGRFWSAYTLTQIIAEHHRSWGFGSREAARRAAWGSYAAMTLVELGDAVSEPGWSSEDFLFSTLGSVAGYFFYLNPDLNRKIDFRVEHSLRDARSRFMTDYENLRYTAVIKLSGFDGVRNPLLKPLEFHLGYYTRGFEGDRSNRQRYLYTGIGLNLSYFADRLGWRKVAQGLTFVQLPHTTLRYEYEFDD